MRIRYHIGGRIYLIEAPPGSRVGRGRGIPGDGRRPRGDSLLVPWKGRMVAVPEDPPELLPLLADAGRLGLRLLRVEEASASGVAKGGSPGG
jgi:hypothetical protein